LTYDALRQAILFQFQVKDVTIMYQDKYVNSQESLEDLLYEQKTEYDLTLYDAFDNLEDHTSPTSSTSTASTTAAQQAAQYQYDLTHNALSDPDYIFKLGSAYNLRK